MHKTICTTILAGLLVAICLVVSGCGSGSDTYDISNDMTIVWGGVSGDRGNAIARGPVGNTYVAGIFSDEVDFDPGPEADLHSSITDYDADLFLAKYNGAGEYQWVTTWGSPGDDWWSADTVHDIAVDVDDNIYVGGYFLSGWFDPGEEIYEYPPTGSSKAFLVKFNTNGNLIWDLIWEDIKDNSILGVEADSTGNVYVTGYFTGTIDLDPGEGTEEYTSNGDADVFLIKLDTAGNFIWARTWGGGTGDYPSAITFDHNNGYVIVSGSFHSETIDFDPGPDTDEHHSFSGYDAFIAKLSTEGNYEWAKTWGAYGDDRGPDVGVDYHGNISVTGNLNEPMDVNPGEGIHTLYSNGGSDVYLINFNEDGEFQWAHNLGGADNDMIMGVFVEFGGYIFVAGTYNGRMDIDPGPGVVILKPYHDVCLSVFNPHGKFQWAGQWESSDFEGGGGIAVSTQGSAFITGYTEEYPSEVDADQDMGPPSQDAFLIRIPPRYWLNII